MSTTNPLILEQLQRARTPKAKKAPTPIAKQSVKKIEQIKLEKKTGVNADKDAWFDYHMTHNAPKCDECGMEAEWLLLPEYMKLWKACQAHILPKKKSMFPSLRANLDNHIILFPSFGGKLCGCHGEYDSSWFQASTMNIWPHIVKVFKEKLYRLIPANEHKNIPEQLLKLVVD